MRITSRQTFIPVGIELIKRYSLRTCLEHSPWEHDITTCSPLNYRRQDQWHKLSWWPAREDVAASTRPEVRTRQLYYVAENASRYYRSEDTGVYLCQMLGRVTYAAAQDQYATVFYMGVEDVDKSEMANGVGYHLPRAVNNQKDATA